MGFFNVQNILRKRIRLDVKADPYVFYEVKDGYAILQKEVKAGSLTLGSRIPLSCMFDVFWLIKRGQKVGHYFTSQFQISNHGGYLVTYMNNGAGKASMVEVMLKTDDLVVYNFPNKGTLVISTKVNEETQTVFAEQ